MTADQAAEATTPHAIPYAFQYRLPEEFVHVPEPLRAASWDTAIGRLVPGTSAEEREAYGKRMLAALPTLLGLDEVLIDMAVCLGREDGDDGYRMSMGLLVVATRPSEHTDRLIAAEGIYRAKEKALFGGETGLAELDFARGKGRQGKQDSLLAAKLPCGPGVLSVSLRTVRMADIVAARAAAGEQVPSTAALPDTLTTATLQLIIPAPSGYFVYITLTTPMVDLLDSYTGRMSFIGRTFSFDVPD